MRTLPDLRPVQPRARYIPGVAKGLESVMGNGVLAGFPVIGCKATLMDGAYHDVRGTAGRSLEAAFTLQGFWAPNVF